MLDAYLNMLGAVTLTVMAGALFALLGIGLVALTTATVRYVRGRYR